MKIRVAAAVAFFAFMFARGAYAEALSVHGSTTFSAAVFDEHRDVISKNSGLTLDVVDNGSGNGLADLAQGKADVAMLSSRLEDAAEEVNARSPGTVDVAAYKPVDVTTTHVAFTVNSSNPVKELKAAQIADILSGKIANWKDVGGSDKSILVVTEMPTGGLRSEVEKVFLGGFPISANKRELANASMIRKIVEQTPGALGIMGAAPVNDKVFALKVDKPIDVMLSYVTKGDPSPAARRLIDATLAAVRK